MGNDAFISYSHTADGVLAPALERGLERLARPWYRVRALNVFRDQSDLAVTPHLWETIRLTLDGSRYLVALLSPESASSKWVNQELAHWCAERGTGELLLVLTGVADRLRDEQSSSVVPSVGERIGVVDQADIAELGGDRDPQTPRSTVVVLDLTDGAQRVACEDADVVEIGKRLVLDDPCRCRHDAAGSRPS